MTREEAYDKLEAVVGQYILREDGPISINEWRDILSALKGETNDTNLTIDDWSTNEIKVLKFMIKCGYEMIDTVLREDLGTLYDFSESDMYSLVCKLGLEDVT